MSKPEGFSLIELLIVVAIILIVAAIAIPNLLRARIAANEASAVSSMRTIVSAEATYQMAYPTVGFAATLAQLGPGPAGSTCSGPSQALACLVDSLLSNATSAAAAKSGYFFNVAGITGGSVVVSYTAGASASGYNSTGVRDFCSIEDGVLRFQNPSGQSAPVIISATCITFTALR
ncbi:MAG: prepilin-type N-terminal cleavage/methylation domain-containing protein [Terriglobales bacterium]